LESADESVFGNLLGVIPIAEEVERNRKQLIAPVQGDLVEQAEIAVQYRLYSLSGYLNP
jgi:hypothetical protein